MCDPLTPVVMETTNCFDLHDLVLNDDDDIQDNCCKLYKFHVRYVKSFTKFKAKFENVKLEKDELIAKLDEANKLSETFINQFSSQKDKIKS